jgi:hypothetical protein
MHHRQQQEARESKGEQERESCDTLGTIGESAEREEGEARRERILLVTNERKKNRKQRLRGSS